MEFIRISSVTEGCWYSIEIHFSRVDYNCRVVTKDKLGKTEKKTVSASFEVICFVRKPHFKRDLKPVPPENEAGETTITSIIP
jgi:hypothetical protein